MTDGFIKRYQIEADWIINDICNYSCDYCFSHSKRDNTLSGVISLESYANFFNKTSKTWLFHFSGGEPLLYPDFVNLCRVLSIKHYIALNTNLSTKTVLEFAESISADRVEYIHCGLHPAQRMRHEGYDILIARIKTLLDKGMPIFASCVMVPSIFNHFEQLQIFLKEMDVPLIPKALRGNYKGFLYPESYTTEQCEKIRRFAKRAEDISSRSVYQPMRYYPTVNPLLDQYFLDGFPDFNGELCSAGKNFVRIKPDGTIYRCGRSTIIGNLHKKELMLNDRIKPCDDSCCPYICLKYSELGLSEARKKPKRFHAGKETE